MSSVIRKATLEDIHQIYDLYKAVTKHNPGNLTQEDYEVTIDYVEEMLKTSLERGLALVVERDGEIIGYFKAFTSKFKCLAHVLGDGTLMVSPEYQKQGGYGAKLLIKAFNEIKSNMQHIYKFDIFPHESNTLAIQMYQKFDFKLEVNNSSKIRNYDGSFGGEVLMSWKSDNFCLNALNKYHDYLKQKYFVKS
jgi:L-amino acid N-acyltransferase YncA